MYTPINLVSMDASLSLLYKVIRNLDYVLWGIFIEIMKCPYLFHNITIHSRSHQHSLQHTPSRTSPFQFYIANYHAIIHSNNNYNKSNNLKHHRKSQFSSSITLNSISSNFNSLQQEVHPLF